MKGFFSMPTGDRAYLVAVLLFAALSFLPWSRSTYFEGIALLGWLMAGLMVFAPIWALVRILREPPGSDAGDQQ